MAYELNLRLPLEIAPGVRIPGLTPAAFGRILCYRAIRGIDWGWQP